MEKTNVGKCMTFRYTVIKESCYLEQTDEIEEFGDEFDYTPSTEALSSALKSIVVRDYGLDAWVIVADLDLVEYVAEYYEEELKDIFEQEAMDFYEG